MIELLAGGALLSAASHPALRLGDKVLGGGFRRESEPRGWI